MAPPTLALRRGEKEVSYMWLYVVYANRYATVQSDTNFTLGFIILAICIGSVFVFTFVRKLLR